MNLENLNPKSYWGKIHIIIVNSIYGDANDDLFSQLHVMFCFSKVEIVQLKLKLLNWYSLQACESAVIDLRHEKTCKTFSMLYLHFFLVA